MKDLKRVVLAYSGGVDTSVCIPYLKEKYGVSEAVSYTHLTLPTTTPV